MWEKFSPVAAVHVEEDDDKAEAVASQVGAAEKPGESSSAVLPPCNLMRYEHMRGSVSRLGFMPDCSSRGPIPAVMGRRHGCNKPLINCRAWWDSANHCTTVTRQKRCVMMIPSGAAAKQTSNYFRLLWSLKKIGKLLWKLQQLDSGGKLKNNKPQLAPGWHAIRQHVT